MKQPESHLGALVSHDAVLYVRTNSSRLFRFFMDDPFVRHHIPDVRFEADLRPEDSSCANDLPPYQLIFNETIDAPSAEFDQSRRSLSINGMLDRDYSEIMFVFNVLQMFSRMYQEKGSFALHSGGITFGTGAALILGGEEAGKSTVTALLCFKLGATYLCDERALVSYGDEGVDWIGGNTVLRLRSVADVGLYAGSLGSGFEDVSDASVARHKACFQVRQPHNAATAVRHIFFVKLASNESGIRRHHHESAIYKLYAALSEDIHGVWSPILAAGYAVPSIDSVQLCQKRLAMAQALASETISLWRCYGEANDVCEMISETVLKDVQR